MPRSSSAEPLTFGVEVETIGPLDPVEAAARAVGGTSAQQGRRADTITSRFGVWSAVYDGSIEKTTEHPEGREFVSPVFTYNETDRAKVSGFVTALAGAGFAVNHTCGLHVHVGVGGRHKDPALILAALALSYEWGRVIHLLTCDRRLEGSFCEPHSSWGLAAFAGFYAGDVPPTYLRVMRRVLDADPRSVGPATDKLTLPRNFGVNLTSLTQHGTIEYRFFESTLDSALVLACVELSVRLTERALASRPLLRPQREATEANVEALMDILGVTSETRAALVTPEVRKHAQRLAAPAVVSVPHLDLSLLDTTAQRLARRALAACG